MKNLFLKLILLYQKFPKISTPCRFQPTCSEYSYQAIDKYGILKGSFLSLRRIFKCHPWNQGGFDPLK